MQFDFINWKTYFSRFEHNVNQSTVHLPANSMLAMVYKYKYEGRSSPILQFHLNKSEGLVDIPIPPNSYFYWTKEPNFQEIFGIGVFDEKGNLILSPWSEIHGTVTEFGILLSPSTFSIEGINF